MATMKKNSAAYWQKRAEEREKKWLKKSREEIEKELKQMYVRALANIRKETDALYARFAADNQLSLKEAHKLIQGSEFSAWRMDIEEYVKSIDETKNPELLKELNTLAMRSRISRLDKLQGETLRELHKLSIGYEAKLTKFLNTALKDQYYSNLFDLNKATGIALPGARLNAAMIEDILRNPWSGKHYSKRIWGNTTKLARVVKAEMTDGMIRGVNAQRMAKNIAAKMNASYSQALTLVRTELNYINNQASLKSMKAAGAGKYRYLVTLDHRTSTQCRELDGTVHKIEDASPGTNLPPLHPRCRSSIAAEYEAITDIGKRFARDDEGKSIRVPTDINYKEWKEKYIDVSQKGKRDKIKETAKESVKAAETIKAANLADAEKYARENLGFKRVNYKNIDLDVANQMNQAISEMYAEYPVLKGFVQELRTDGRIKATAQAGMYYKNGQLGTALTISSTQLNYLGSFKKLLEKNVLQKWWSPKDGVSGVIRHELAHMLEYSFVVKRNGLALGCVGRNEVNRVFAEIKKGAFSSKIGHKALENLGIDATPKAITEHLSAYASKSSLEFLAEAVSEHQPRALAAEVVKLLQKELEGMKLIALPEELMDVLQYDPDTGKMKLSEQATEKQKKRFKEFQKEIEDDRLSDIDLVIED